MAKRSAAKAKRASASPAKKTTTTPKKTTPKKKVSNPKKKSSSQAEDDAEDGPAAEKEDEPAKKDTVPPLGPPAGDDALVDVAEDRLALGEFKKYRKAVADIDAETSLAPDERKRRLRKVQLEYGLVDAEEEPDAEPAAKKPKRSSPRAAKK
mmetsp:Transcript_7853/g.32457  ORF Transcript_7853/g.32457 Transcript_7853/m.32457 type:complete len:152 (+) Transcript_7853:482-937(+)